LKSYIPARPCIQDPGGDNPNIAFLYGAVLQALGIAAIRRTFVLLHYSAAGGAFLDLGITRVLVEAGMPAAFGQPEIDIRSFQCQQSYDYQ
jgi:hypothetical protein